MNYYPKPFNTDSVDLNDEILEIIETIAKNTHEVWAATRLKEGWRYGAEYDGVQKLHPCLIPFEALPESEKDYDRGISVQVIKVRILKGYHISKQK